MATNSIPSSIIGQGPDPFMDPSYSLRPEHLVENPPQFMHGGRVVYRAEPSGGIQGDPETNVRFSVLSRMKAAFWNLATKLGYVKKKQTNIGTPPHPTRTEDEPMRSPPAEDEPMRNPTADQQPMRDPTPNIEPMRDPTADRHPMKRLKVEEEHPMRDTKAVKQPTKKEINVILHDDEHYEFECMSDTDTPILVEGRPVVVTEPQDCHRYFMNYATFADPGLIFVQEARIIFKSDDQDLDDRVIKALWEENQGLRDQVQQMKSSIGDRSEEAMTAVLRDRINGLLTANADLEREVARLRYAEAARGAAESVETLEKLRKTRDTLNTIVDENDQLKIEVGKSRYGSAMNSAAAAAQDKLQVAELDWDDQHQQQLEQHQEQQSEQEPSSTEPGVVTVLVQEDPGLTKSWTSRRSEQIKRKLKQAEPDEGYETDNNDEDRTENFTKSPHKKERHHNKEKRHDQRHQHRHDDESGHKRHQHRHHDDDDDEDDTIEHPGLLEFSRKLSRSLSKLGRGLFDKSGTINWDQTKSFFSGMQDDIKAQLSSLGVLSQEDLSIFYNKFAELKTFVDTERISDVAAATKTASKKMLKTLMGAVKELQDATEDAAEDSNWSGTLKKEINKIKTGMDKRWEEVKHTWQKIVTENDNVKYQKDGENKQEDKDEDDDDDDHYEHGPNESGRSKRQKKKKTTKWSQDNDEDDMMERRTRHNKDEQKKMKRKDEGDYDDDWMTKRERERRQAREEEQKTDWVFERAKKREEDRKEERRGDWYTDRQERRHADDDQPQNQPSGDRKQNKDGRQNKYNKDHQKNYKDDGKDSHNRDNRKRYKDDGKKYHGDRKDSRPQFKEDKKKSGRNKKHDAHTEDENLYMN